jgi:hypothetical protein
MRDGRAPFASCAESASGDASGHLPPVTSRSSVKLVEVSRERHGCQIGEPPKARGVTVRALRADNDTGFARPGGAVT